MSQASFSWIKRVISRFHASQGGPRRRTRRLPRRSLALELLEQRDCPTALSGPFNPADLLVVTNNTLNEYTTGGSLVQSFAVAYPGTRPTGEDARGVAVGSSGLAYIFNGTASPYLSSLDPSAAAWTHTALTGGSVGAVSGYGEVGQFQQYVFAPGMTSPDGIFRLDTSSGTVTAFATANLYSDVSVGLDGNLYALNSGGSSIDVYNPSTMNLLGAVNLTGASGAAASVSGGLAVDASGNIFSSDSSGDIVEFNSSGVATALLSPSNGSITSIALAANGQISAGTSAGGIIVTTESLSSFTTFSTGSSADAYVAFVAPQMTAFTSSASTTFSVGSAGSFTVQTSGTLTAPLTETGALPSGVTFTDNGNGSASLAGTPAAGTGGVYTFTITAQDKFGSDATQSFTLTVDEAPSITSAASVEFGVGAAGTFTVTTGHDFPAATTLQRTGTLPSGVTFTDNGNGTATLAGTPAAGTIGTYPLTITASNGVANDFVQSFTLTVGLGTKATLTVSPSAPAYGKPLALTASVAPVSGSIVLSGTVTFFDGTTQIGSPVRLSRNTAALITTALGAGSHSLTAVYSGGGAYAPSTSPAVSKSISAASTEVFFTLSTLAPVYGQPITVSTHVMSLTAGTATPSGTVTLMDGTNSMGSGTLTNGVATITDQTFTAGTHALTVVFVSSNPNELGSTSAVHNISVAPARTTVTFSAAPNPVVFGQSVTLTAHVNVAAPAVATPTASVTFKDGVNVIGTAPVVDGIATLSTTSLTTGSHTLQISYGADGTTAASGTLARLTVDRTATTVDLSSSPSSSLAKQPVTLTATVAVVAPGVATPTGTVAFFHGIYLLGTAPVSNGVASFVTQKLSAGTFKVTAVYRGSLDCKSSSTSWTVTVNPIGRDADTVTLDSSANPSATGSPTTFTASVAAVNPADGTPTGTVTFWNGKSLLGEANLDTGNATLANANLSNGVHSITAVYSGDVTFAANTSAALSQMIQVGTATTLTLSTLAPVFGQPLTITARVSPVSFSTVTPSGTVTFMDGSTVLGTVTMTNGVATLSSQTLAVGQHSLSTVFVSGNNADAGNTSNILNVAISPAHTTTTFSASPGTPVFGQSVTLTATVTVAAPGAATPTGTVTFSDGTNVLGTASVSSGIATLATANLSTGSHTLTIAYGGDTDTATSSTLARLTVNQDATTVDLSSSPLYSKAGQTVTLTAQVNAVAPGVTTPTGIVAFYHGTTLLGTSTLSNGTVSYITPKLSAGAYTVTAVYRGSTNCKTSNSTWTVTALNPPVISSVTLASANAADPSGTVSINGGDLVTATVSASDPQGRTITYTYVWMVNGTAVQTDSNLSAATDQLDLSTVPVTDGQTVSVIVTPNDGIDGAAVTSNNLNVVDAPVIRSLTLASANNADPSGTVAIDAGDKVTATVVASDPQSYSLTYTYVWMVNGTAVHTDSAVAAASDQLDLSTIPVSAGQTVSVAVTANNGVLNSTASTSNTLTVTTADPPVISSVTLASANNADPSGTVSISGGDVVTATVSASDPQGFTLTYTYVWMVNGAAVQTDSNLSTATDQLNLSTIPVSAGQTVSVVVTANNGVVNSTATDSNTLNVTA